MNISGDYRTAEKEIAVVKRIFDENSIPYLSVEKSENADDGDVTVTLPDGREFLIEVKQEDYARFISFGGDLGIDYISAFNFKDGVNAAVWKKLHGPEDLAAFKEAIDRERSYKGGKVFYSKSHLWLFFVLKPDGGFYYCKFFEGDKMTSPEFINYIENNCRFAANAKSESQQSHGDKHNSACFFLNHRSAILKNYAVDIREYFAAQ